MNILIVGGANSIFVKDYCLEVLSKKKYNVVILSGEPAGEYSREYELNGIKVVDWHKYYSLKELKNVLKFRKRWDSLIKEIGICDNIDVFHIHYASFKTLVLFSSLWKKSSKKILTFWGSDLAAISKTGTMIMKRFVREANNIVLMIENQRGLFCSKFGEQYNDKTQVIDFGNKYIYLIEEIEKKHDKESAKKKFGLKDDRYVIHVGYNAVPGQHHIDIVDSLKNIGNDAKKKALFVFPMAYGVNKNFNEYKAELIQKMEENHMDYLFFEDLIFGEALATFRQTADCFVYGQEQDARSDSPLEYIYAGAQFICPRWLADNYRDLCANGVKYYNNFSELAGMVDERIRNNVIVSADNLLETREKIRENKSWVILKEKWSALYE